MKNIIEIMKAYGIEIPADKVSDFNKEVSENYKTIAEHEKKVSKAETERDNWKERAENAETTLKGFEGIDPQKLNDEIATWKKKAEDAEAEFNAKLEAKAFDEALSDAVKDYEFSSAAAKKAVMAELKESVSFKNGKLYGVSDAIKDIQGRDASAFVEKNVANNAARFTTPSNTAAKDGSMTKSDIMAIKDRTERRAAMAKNFHLFTGGNN